MFSHGKTIAEPVVEAIIPIVAFSFQLASTSFRLRCLFRLPPPLQRMRSNGQAFNPLGLSSRQATQNAPSPCVPAKHFVTLSRPRYRAGLPILAFSSSMLAVFLPLLLAATSLTKEAPTPEISPVPLRVVAANLTSGNHQTYSPDNGNHSNPEGAGARILKALAPDVVLIQEFNTTVPVRQWINQTLGPEFQYVREAEEKVPNFIPNGVISRFPIVDSGEWDDPTQTNRDFVWAKIRLPNGKFLWAISVHLYSKKPAVRAKEARALEKMIRAVIPPEDLMVLGGDFNTRSENESSLDILDSLFPDPDPEPADRLGDSDTNAKRNSPYDRVLADAELDPHAVPVVIGGQNFRGGLVFDSRVFTPLSVLPPVQPGDSATPNMQHMAVVRDFLIP
jgi:endonuclease/exonuclease/phosphatase family metal-dependent hydrolase